MNDTIISSLTKVKSIWQLLREVPIVFDNIEWVMLLNNLIPLFRKDTFANIVKMKSYYPQSTPNCRYYVKPNDGSCGKGIKIINEMPSTLIKGHTICPEIITPLIMIENDMCKYDYRAWIGITSNLEYYVCPTIIKRISTVPFDITKTQGSLTNTSLYGKHLNYQDEILSNKINCIVNDVLKNIPIHVSDQPNNQFKTKSVMLTGWDFIENTNGELFVLEANCSPGVNIQHTQVMTEFLQWINSL